MKNNDKDLFDSILILRFSETKVAKEELYSAKKPSKFGMLMLII